MSGTDGQRGGFRLEKGATGFRHVSEPALPDVGASVCRAAWQGAARAAHGRLGEFAGRGYPENFHRATIADRGGVHEMLFHAHQPLIAFVTVRRHWYTDEFRDPPRWGAAFGDAGFVVLSAAQLLSPLGEWDTSVLSPAETSQIEHWQPANLGATLFNAWD